MELVRRLYERMRLVTRIYKVAAALLLLAAIGLAARLMYVSQRVESMRRQAADVFYQLKALELEVARLATDAPQRREYLERRAGLETLYDEWLLRLDENSRGPADERAIRAAVARLGEMPVLASDEFIHDVRERVAAWRRTADFRAAVRYAGDLYLLDAAGSGLLVMACYNAGQTRLLRLLRSLPATPRERNFWRLLERHRDRIPDETYGYVVGIVAAAAVAAEPGAFGLPR